MTLKELRTNAGLKQKDVADRAGIPYTTYRDIEQGYRTSIHGTAGEVLQKIAAALKVTTDDILGCTTKKTMYATVTQDKTHAGSGDEWVEWFTDEEEADKNSRYMWDHLADSDKKTTRIYTMCVEDDLFAMENGQWVFDPDGDWYEEETSDWYFDSDFRDELSIGKIYPTNFDLWANPGNEIHGAWATISTDGVEVEDYDDAEVLAEEAVEQLESSLGRDIIGKEERGKLLSDVRDIFERMIRDDDDDDDDDN